MVRLPRHMQGRSHTEIFSFEKCEHAWLFHCVQGKDKSKPFNWVIPALTSAGTQGAFNMISAVRAVPPEGEDPWLIPQFGPNTADPMAATHWRNTKMTGSQMARGRQNLLKEYPMNARYQMSSFSYASRRAGSNLLALGAPAVIRTAHGNWKSALTEITQRTGMADIYTEEK